MFISCEHDLASYVFITPGRSRYTRSCSKKKNYELGHNEVKYLILHTNMVVLLAKRFFIREYGIVYLNLILG